MKNSNLFKNLQDISLYCIDLGSRAGLPKYWQKCLKSLNIDAFDPDVEAEDKGYKRIKNVNWYSYDLAKKTGNFNFYLTSTPSGSSLYEPKYRKYNCMDFEKMARPIKLKDEIYVVR